MTTYKNTGAYPVHVPLSVGVNAHVTRTDESWGAEGDDRPALHDTEGVAVVLWPGDLVDTDEVILSGIVRRVNEAGEVIEDPEPLAEEADPEPPAPAEDKNPKTPADDSAPKTEE